MRRSLLGLWCMCVWGGEREIRHMWHAHMHKNMHTHLYMCTCNLDVAQEYCELLG